MHGNYNIQRDYSLLVQHPRKCVCRDSEWSCTMPDRKQSEEQTGVRSKRGCIERIFMIRQLMEKYLETEEMFAAFIDMERHMTKCGGTHVGTFERIWSEGQVILGSIKTLYKESKACVRVVEDLTGRKGSGRTRSKTGVSLIPMVA